MFSYLHARYLYTVALLLYGGRELDLDIETSGFRHTLANLF
jgi:hypothetical protein